MKPNAAKIFVIAVLALLITSSVAVYRVSAQATTIYLNPSNNVYTTSTVSVGFKFNVSVWVQNTAVPIGGAQIYMEFNDSIINATRWFVPDTNSSFFMPEPPAVTIVPPPPDPAYIHIGSNLGSIGGLSVSKGGLPPVAPWGHDGLIMIIEFKVTAVPSSPGKFTSALHMNTADTFLLDADANTIGGVVVQDGHYEVSMPAPPAPNYLTITATTGGTTNPAPGVHQYTSGATATVTAIPSGQYALDHWELDGASIGSANPVDVTMNINHTLHAVFEIPTGVHDVAVTNIAHEAFVYQSSNAIINVTAKNLGAFTETFDLKLYFNATLMATNHVTALTAGSSYISVFNVTSAKLMTLLPSHVYQLKGEATAVPGESNTTNNALVNGFLKIRLPGDTNDDGLVNMVDVFAVHSAFASMPGLPRWNPDCELNGDGKIDLKDVLIVHRYFRDFSVLRPKS